MMYAPAPLIVIKYWPIYGSAFGWKPINRIWRFGPGWWIMRKLSGGLARQDVLAVNSQSPANMGKALPHESAVRQVSGQARYVDDMPEPANLLHAAVGGSQLTSGTIKKLDLQQVWRSPGVVDVITVNDVPGHTDIAPVFDGDPVLADGKILFHGQPVFAVLADTADNARRAALLAEMDIEPT